MPTRIHIAAYTLVLSSFLLVPILSGCSQTVEAPSLSTLPGAASSAAQSSDADSPQKSYTAAQSGNIPVTNAIADEEHPKSATAGTQSDSAADSNADAADSSVGQIEALWDPDNPQLHNIALAETEEALDLKVGEPLDEYVLQDEEESLSVREYDGFAIGLSENDTVQYVEVFARAVSPGLSGLRIGDQAEAALKLLGKPTTQTANVLTYKAGSTLLKLDLDPESDSILSMKLFYDNSRA
ncbi:hypothetical protein FHS18_002079 [Paenibacillus phyllosphaerae]|uniref:Uncharacterized protein n=1 Tax=Paenibacillus phyllosphaerae TaxID=274593 RepID=A0A7W5AXM4_9BACL|nr:hypothetical protein [Paenibacillus phyllosphaerae]MBB3110016.1 hypothetical protein [Paenibacillus phyllosphaerae]